MCLEAWCQIGERNIVVLGVYVGWWKVTTEEGHEGGPKLGTWFGAHLHNTSPRQFRWLYSIFF